MDQETSIFIQVKETDDDSGVKAGEIYECVGSCYEYDVTWAILLYNKEPRSIFCREAAESGIFEIQVENCIPLGQLEI